MSFTNIKNSNVNLYSSTGFGYKNMVGTHYSLAQNSRALRDWAWDAAEFIHTKYGGVENMVAFCYRGFSGVAMATALSMAYAVKYDIQLNLLYVRKFGEKSHGCPSELNFDDNDTRIEECVFVDDFIDGGGTFCQVKGSVEAIVGKTDWICLCQRVYVLHEPGLWPEGLDYQEMYYFPG